MINIYCTFNLLPVSAQPSQKREFRLLLYLKDLNTSCLTAYQLKSFVPKQPGAIISSISRGREQANVISWLWPRWDWGLYYLAIRETQLQL